MFTTTGNTHQQAIALTAIARFNFPWERMAHSLSIEGKDTVEVAWEDLSRYSTRAAGTGHSHIHIGDAVAHPIERTIDGRHRVLGLFYLPPYTKVVIDSTLENDPQLAAEVIGSELAHAVDYHTLTPRDRWAIVNILHNEDLVAGADTSDGATFHLDGHDCSWFDVGPYEAWVGEAFMESFVEAFSDMTSTMSLMHPTGPDQARQVHDLLLPPLTPGDELAPDADLPAPDPEPVVECSPAEVALDAAITGVQEALRRYEDNTKPAVYLLRALRDLSKAAEAWRAEGPA